MELVMPVDSKDEKLIFLAAIEESNSRRAEFVERACAGDMTLLERVQQLLSLHQNAAGPLDAPPPGVANGTHELRPTERPGTVIGAYKLIEQIGEGGFGIVFMAEQQTPVRRKVAFKIVKPGMDTRQIVARFEAERQALAMMDHPNIARVLDGGATDAGRPYFVMDLVRGLPITDYCDQNQLRAHKRLELFIAVCQAVQHAHQKGIIHRDIKPSNVLVTLHDGTPTVKVIDFGIAKALGHKLTDKTLVTGFAQMVGTPLYMSPEQAEQSGEDMDTRSDIYSLGVLLYELLTGTTPFEKARLHQAGYDEMRRIIREEEPHKPSTRLSTMQQAHLATIAEQRGLEPQHLSRQLRGELDWIVMKALEKDRNRRYESASAFAADVQRYLNEDAVEACPPSRWYRVRKFARRNRRGMMTVGIVGLALVTATAVSIWQAVIAREAQHQAQAAESRAATEAAIAKAVNEFLQQDMLGQAASAHEDRGLREDPPLTVKEAVNRAAARIDQRFQDQPLVEAAVRTAIGSAYSGLGENQLAVPHLQRAVKLRKAYLGPYHPDALASMDKLANAYSWLGRYTDAIALHQQILEHYSARLGPDHPKTLHSALGLATDYHRAGQWDTSIRLHEQLLEKWRAVYGPAHGGTLDTMHRLALHYGQAGRFAESIDLFEQCLAYTKASEVAESKPDSWLWESFAHVCQYAGKLYRAEDLLLEALERNRNRDDSFVKRQERSDIVGWLALNRLLKQQYRDAEPLAREALEITEKLPLVNGRRFFWMSLLGAVLLGKGEYANAEPLLLQGYEGMKSQELIVPTLRRREMPQAGEWIVHFYEETNQPEKAQVWRERLRKDKSKQ
jgi:serine/threonine protein kinase/tetratricopeptide (TPR) repeat protein